LIDAYSIEYRRGWILWWW